MKDIKIFVSHRIDLDADCLDQDIYVPVRCGAVFDNKSSTIAGDDTGDNISEKRMSFCELTVQYWAWKNVDAEYYGLCHYRRYLAFSDEKFEKCSSEHDNNCIPVNYVSDLNRQIYGINRANIEKYLQRNASPAAASAGPFAPVLDQVASQKAGVVQSMGNAFGQEAAQEAGQVMDDFQRINREMHITVLINIHHVELALQYATRVVGIRAGEIVYDGPADQVDQAVLDAIYQGKQEEPA